MRIRTFILNGTIAAMLFSVTACSSANFGLTPVSSVFQQKVVFNNEVDILWVVDNSGSMGPHQAQLAQKVTPFLDGLLQKGLDFHIAVTTTDMGNGGAKGRFLTTPDNNPAVLTASTPDLYQVLAQRFLAGQNGSTVEQGRAAMRASFTEPMIGTFNSGFLRQNSLLVVIFLTDEKDSSPNLDYAAFLDQL